MGRDPRLQAGWPFLVGAWPAAPPGVVGMWEGRLPVFTVFSQPLRGVDGGSGGSQGGLTDF